MTIVRDASQASPWDSAAKMIPLEAAIKGMHKRGIPVLQKDGTGQTPLEYILKPSVRQLLENAMAYERANPDNAFKAIVDDFAVKATKDLKTTPPATPPAAAPLDIIGEALRKLGVQNGLAPITPPPLKTTSPQNNSPLPAR